MAPSTHTTVDAATRAATSLSAVMACCRTVGPGSTSVCRRRSSELVGGCGMGSWAIRAHRVGRNGTAPSATVTATPAAAAALTPESSTTALVRTPTNATAAAPKNPSQPATIATAPSVDINSASPAAISS